MSASASSRARRRLAVIAGSLAALLAADQLGVALYYQHMNARYGVVPSQPADAAVVLFGGYAGHGTLDAETHRRVRHAAALFAAGVVSAILCSGGRRDPDEGAGSQLMAAALEKWGVPRGRIQSEAESFDTLTNVTHSLRAAESRGWRSLVFVSSPVHLGRVRQAAEGSRIRISYSAYTAGPPGAAVPWSEKTWQVHHEWAARAAYLALPREIYLEWVARWRKASSPTQPPSGAGLRGVTATTGARAVRRSAPLRRGDPLRVS